MNLRVTIKWAALLLAIVMLLMLCSCELFANFNDGMTEEDKVYDVEAAEKGEKLGGKIVGGFLAVAIIVSSSISFFDPEASWNMTTGWRYQNLEPSDISLTLRRVGGGIGMAVGAVALLYFIFS